MEKSTKSEKVFVCNEDDKIEIIVRLDPITQERFFLVTNGYYCFTSTEINFPDFQLIV